MNRKRLGAVMAAALGVSLGVSGADPAVPATAIARMPVKEVTVFKDGHAFVLHSGKMTTDASGNVVMDYLPQSVLGTFWPYSADGRAKLISVTAGQRKLAVERTALSLRDLIEANIGAEVLVTESSGQEQGGSGAARRAGLDVSAPYSATIVSIPEQSGEELEATQPPNGGERLAQKGNVVLLKTDVGLKVVSLDRVHDITFKSGHKKSLSREEFRNFLTLKLDWGKDKPAQEADVGMVYLQKGLRWIPNYKVDIDGDGNAVVSLQATLINELADLADATVNLVVGVPSFAFKTTMDPMALQKVMAQLSPYFQENADSQYAFSNAIMSQSARMTEYRQPPSAAAAPAGMDLGPEVAGSEKNEDLFIYTVRRVTMKKGERMVLPVTQFKLKYRDVYTLDIPFVPPVEVWRKFGSSQQAELARLFHSPKVMHKIRLSNTGEAPLTTAPALILRGNKVLAQGMMTYTSVGGESDLDVTTAVDVSVKKSDEELKRTPNAAVWQGDAYGRIDLAGKITLTSYGRKPVEVEVIRNALGNVESADHDGKTEMVNIREDYTYAPAGLSSYPYWWTWYSWPYWWHHFNGVGRIKWTVKLEPGKPLDLNYKWNYYWR